MRIFLWKSCKKEVRSSQYSKQICFSSLISDFNSPWYYHITDEYFLSNVKTIDDMTAGRKTRLINTTQWSARFSYSIETWPCYNLITDLGQINYSNINCSGCGQRGISARLILYGQPYNPNTVALIQLDHRIPYDKVIATIRRFLPLYSNIANCNIMFRLFRTWWSAVLVCHFVNCCIKYHIRSI